MLTLKEPIRLQCEANLITVEDSFGERIRGNYSLFPTSIAPKDLLLLLTASPELPEESHDMTMLVEQNNQTIQTGITFDVINNIVNRILLTQQTPFTYQDTVYISNMLQRMGITDVAQFMRQVRQVAEEAQHIQRLTAFYQTHYTLLQQAAPVPPSREGGQATGATAPASHTQERYFLHNAIYQRLQTAAVYHTVSQFVTNTASTERTVSFREMQVAEQARVSTLLRLGELRQQTVDQQASLTLQHTQNHYERGDLLSPPATETQVFAQLAEAALLDIVSKAVTFLSMRHLQQNSVWLHLQQAVRQSVDNTIFRFEQWHQQIYPQQGDILLAEESRNTLYQQELSLLQKLVHRMSQTQQTLRQEGTSIVQQTQHALSLLSQPETVTSPSSALPPFVFVQAIREVLFTERAAFAPIAVIQQAVEQLTQRILPLIDGQSIQQPGRVGSGKGEIPSPSRLVLQHDLAQTETAFLLEQFDQLDAATQELLERKYQLRFHELQEQQREMRLEDVQALLAETLATMEAQPPSDEQPTETQQQRVQHTQFNCTAHTVIDQLLRMQEELESESIRSETVVAMQPSRPPAGEPVAPATMTLLTPQAETFREQLEQIDQFTQSTQLTTSQTRQTLRLREQFDALEASTQTQLEQSYQIQRQAVETTRHTWNTQMLQQLLRETVEPLAMQQPDSAQAEHQRQAVSYRQFEQDVQQAFTTLQQAQAQSQLPMPIMPEQPEQVSESPVLLPPVASTGATQPEPVVEPEPFLLAQTFREQLAQIERLTQTFTHTSVFLQQQFDSFEPSIQTSLEQQYQTQRDILHSRQQEWTTETVQQVVQETIQTVQAVASQQEEEQQTAIRQRIEQNSQFEQQVQQVLTMLHPIEPRLISETSPSVEPTSAQLVSSTLLHPVAPTEVTSQEILAEWETGLPMQTFREQLTRLDRLTQSVQETPVFLREQFDSLDSATQTFLERHYQTQRDAFIARQEEWNVTTLRRMMAETLRTVAARQEDEKETEVQQRVEQASHFEQNVQQALTTLHQIESRLIAETAQPIEPTQTTQSSSTLLHPVAPTEASPQEILTEWETSLPVQTFREQLTQLDRLTQTAQETPVSLREQFDSLDSATQALLERHYQTQRDTLLAQQEEWNVATFRRIVAETLRTVTTRTEDRQGTTVQQQIEQNSRFEQSVQQALTMLHTAPTRRISAVPQQPALSQPSYPPQSLLHITEGSQSEILSEEETNTQAQTFREQLIQIDRLSQNLQTEHVLLREQFDQLTQSTQERLEQLYQTRQNELRAQQQAFRLEDMQRILAETLQTTETHSAEHQQVQTEQQRTYQEHEERLVENIRDVIEQTRQNRIRLPQHAESEAPLSSAGEFGTEQPTAEMVYHEINREQETETHVQTLREQLDQIDRRNRERLERLRHARTQDIQIQRSEVRRSDTGRTIDDALRALENPEAVMQELLARPAPKPSQPILSPEVQFLLQQTDEPTRRMLETVMRYEADPSASSLPLQRLQPQAFNAETHIIEPPLEEQPLSPSGLVADEAKAKPRSAETWPDFIHPSVDPVTHLPIDHAALSPSAAGESATSPFRSDYTAVPLSPEEAGVPPLSRSTADEGKAESNSAETWPDFIHPSVGSAAPFPTDNVTLSPSATSEPAKLRFRSDYTAFPPFPEETETLPLSHLTVDEAKTGYRSAETWPDFIHPSAGSTVPPPTDDAALLRFAVGEPAAFDSRSDYTPFPPSPEAVAASLAANVPQDTLIHEVAQELIHHPPATMERPVVSTTDWSPMHPLRFIHKTEPTAVTEELIEQLEQHRETLQRSTQTEQNEQIHRQETITVHNPEQTLQRTIERTSEDVTELINRTLARQLGTISDKVYNQIEKRLRLERARRGR